MDTFVYTREFLLSYYPGSEASVATIAAVDRRLAKCYPVKNSSFAKQSWRAREPLILRSSFEVASEEVGRIEPGEIITTSGRVQRVPFDKGELVRVEVASRGWITAVSTTVGPEGKVYIEPPMTEQIHSVGFSGFLLTSGRRWQVIDDLPVYTSPSSFDLVGVLNWGWIITQIGYPVISGEDQIRLKITHPCEGWVVAKECKAGFEHIKLRPIDLEIPDGVTGRIRALTAEPIRSDIEGVTIGDAAVPGKLLDLAGPCILVSFGSGSVRGRTVRAPVTDGRPALCVPRWVTISSLDDTGEMAQFCEPENTLDAKAAEFVPGRLLHKSSANIASFPTPDGSFGKFQVIYAVKSFTRPTLHATRGPSFAVGTFVTQKEAAVWVSEEMEGVKVHCLWIRVDAGGNFLPIIEVRHFTGRFVKYLRRTGDSSKVAKLSLESALVEDESNSTAQLLEIVQKVSLRLIHLFRFQLSTCKEAARARILTNPTLASVTKTPGFKRLVQTLSEKMQ